MPSETDEREDEEETEERKGSDIEGQVRRAVPCEWVRPWAAKSPVSAQVQRDALRAAFDAYQKRVGHNLSSTQLVMSYAPCLVLGFGFNSAQVGITRPLFPRCVLGSWRALGRPTRWASPVLWVGDVAMSALDDLHRGSGSCARALMDSCLKQICR